MRVPDAWGFAALVPALREFASFDATSALMDSIRHLPGGGGAPPDSQMYAIRRTRVSGIAILTSWRVAATRAQNIRFAMTARRYRDDLRHVRSRSHVSYDRRSRRGRCGTPVQVDEFRFPAGRSASRRAGLRRHGMHGKECFAGVALVGRTRRHEEL